MSSSRIGSGSRMPRSPSGYFSLSPTHVLLETPGRDGAVLLHLPEHFLIAAGRLLEVDVQMTAFGDDILVPVAGFLSLVVSFGVCNVALRSGLVAYSGAIHAIVSCHGSTSFLSWV